MSYPLRLPPELDAEARERCQRLGISLNAFIAVALDAYLRSEGRPAAKRPAKAAPAREQRQPERAKPTAAPGGQQPSLDDWREWNDPDMWPLFDPEFEHRWEGVDQTDEAACAAIEAEYWSTRERPQG
jgi:hypothetical protein